MSEPLGLGYEELRRREIASGEGKMPSVFEVGHSSRFLLESERSEGVSASRQTTLTTWTDPEDGMVYIDVPAYPLPAPPIQTPPSPELTSGSFPISPSPSIVPSPISSPIISLTVPSPVASPSTAEAEGFLAEDIEELFTRSRAVRDEIFSHRYIFRSLGHEQERTAVTFGALWRHVEESLDSDSKSEDAEDEGPTAEDEDPTAGDEGLTVRDEGLSMGVESLGLGGDEAVLEGQQRAALVVETTMSEPLGLGYEELRRSRPDWLFDIDALIRTMNYEPISADPPIFQDPKSIHYDGSKPSSDDGKKVDKDPRKQNKCNDREKEDNVNSTNNVNVASTNEDYELLFDPNMPALEDVSIFKFSSDDKDDGTVADMNNLDITIQTESNPMETQKPLLKDKDGEEVDVHMYRLMIGSLMYLTSSRPDIMFVVCACARYQVNLKVSHLHAVKRIFRYLKGQPKLGLWYPKDSFFDLVAYTDSDYAKASLDRMSTTRGCQFFRCRLISW
nr:uncharacterized mitochondrial protein AtMg00810-like [Tanacetum cinerariifolium]